MPVTTSLVYGEFEALCSDKENGKEHQDRLGNIYLGSLVLIYALHLWQKVGIISIPKSGKVDYSNTKGFKLID